MGLHGGAVGTVAWLTSQGANVTITDLKTDVQLKDSLEKLKPYQHVRFVLGRHDEKDFTQADMVIRNPGMPKTSPFLELARQANVPIEMDSSLFFAHCPSADIIGVTGSKGKTTTASAIAVILKQVSSSAVAVGVDGVSPLRELSNISTDSPVVFELSSWRLEALAEKRISPRTAVITSIYPDHLNTYTSFAEYIETKKTIFRFQQENDMAIMNADDATIRNFSHEIKSRLWWYSMADNLVGDGIYIHNQNVCLKKDGSVTVLFPLAQLPLRYEHERRNLLPAILIGFLRGLTANQIQIALKNIARLPHRLETVRELRGVTYINDSAATMPEATVAALQSFAGKPIVHIAGGSDKKLEFAGLAEAQGKANLKAIIWLPGNATDRMRKTLFEVAPNIPTKDAVSMNEAVAQAEQIASGGDIVLLSPGATSFGLFLHEFDRGNKFREAVLNLSE